MKELVFRGITTRDPEQIRWIGLASNRAAPTEILLLLASTDLPDVLESLSRRPFPVPVRDYLIDYWRRTGKAFPLQFPAASDWLPEDVLRELAMSPGPGARAVAADAPSLPIELLTVLAHDPVTEVRLVVSARDDLPEDLAEILVQDSDSYVRRHVATKVGPQWLPVLARDPEPAIRAFVAATPETNAELLDELADDEDPWVRRTLEER